MDDSQKNDFEPLEESCRFLAGLIQTESAREKKLLMLEDYAWKAHDLPTRLKQRLDRLVLDSFVAPEVRHNARIFSTPITDRSYDAAVITITELERKMFMLAFGMDPKQLPEKFGRDRYWDARCESTATGRELRILMTVVGEQRNSPCAAATARLLTRFNVRACFLCGISAGVREDTAFGDVIVGINVADYEGGRLEVGGIRRRGERFKVPGLMRADLRAYDARGTAFRQNLLTAIEKLEPWQLPEVWAPESFQPKQHNQFLVAGEKLIADDSLPQLKDEIDERIRGGEMESTGFAQACEDNTPPIDWAPFRGVSDFGGPDKRKDWQHVAALSAATMLLDFLSTDFDADVRDL